MDSNNDAVLLRPVYKCSGYSRFTDLRGNEGPYFIYEWNPCQDFTDSREGRDIHECKDVAVSVLSTAIHRNYIPCKRAYVKIQKLNETQSKFDLDYFDYVNVGGYEHRYEHEHVHSLRN